MPGSPFESRHAEARELYDQGLGCNEIARRMGVGVATISRWARGAGLKFDRAKTSLAVRARSIDLAEAAQMLAQKMALAASDMLDELDGPYLVYNFGGKDNTYEEHLLDSAPVEVRRNVIVTGGIAFDKATKALERGAGDGNLAEIKAALLGFRDALGEVDLDDDANFSGPRPAEVDEPEAGPVGS